MGTSARGGHEVRGDRDAADEVRYEYRKLALSVREERQADRIIALMAREGWEWLSASCAVGNRATAAKVTCTFRRRCSP